MGFSYSGLTFDYALLYHEALGFSHRFSFGALFGSSVFQRREARRAAQLDAKQRIIRDAVAEQVAGYLSSADKLLLRGDRQGALACYDKALAWDPTHEGAARNYEKLRRDIRDDDIQMHLKAGAAHFKGGAWIEAMIEYKKILELDPDHADANNYLRLAAERAKAESAKACFGLQGDPEEIRRAFERGVNYYAAGEYDKAVLEWNKVVEATPLHQQLFRYLLSAEAQLRIRLEREKRRTGSLTVSERIAELYKQAVALYIKGELSAAIEIWQNIIDLDPDNVDAIANLEKAQRELIESKKKGIRW